MINPINSDWSKSTAYMDVNGTLVTRLVLQNETAVPLSMFCLQGLLDLNIINMPFPNGNPSLPSNIHFLIVFLGIVQDNLGNLKQLHYQHD
jgi:hypothetical protein